MGAWVHGCLGALGGFRHSVAATVSSPPTHARTSFVSIVVQPGGQAPVAVPHAPLLLLPLPLLWLLLLLPQQLPPTPATLRRLGASAATNVGRHVRCRLCCHSGHHPHPHPHHPLGTLHQVVRLDDEQGLRPHRRRYSAVLPPPLDLCLQPHCSTAAGAVQGGRHWRRCTSCGGGGVRGAGRATKMLLQHLLRLGPIPFLLQQQH